MSHVSSPAVITTFLFADALVSSIVISPSVTALFISVIVSVSPLSYVIVILAPVKSRSSPT